jgi:hypothetical protein
MRIRLEVEFFAKNIIVPRKLAKPPDDISGDFIE